MLLLKRLSFWRANLSKVIKALSKLFGIHPDCFLQRCPPRPPQIAQPLFCTRFIGELNAHFSTREVVDEFSVRILLSHDFQHHVPIELCPKTKDPLTLDVCVDRTSGMKEPDIPRIDKVL